MPIAALWYGVIIGEMVYLGSDWIDRRRQRKRAALRRQADRQKARIERHQRREHDLADADRPVYEDYESEYDEDHDRRDHRYIQARSRSAPGTPRRIEYHTRHNSFPAERNGHGYGYGYDTPSSPAVPYTNTNTNTERNLVLANTSTPRDRPVRSYPPQTISDLDYAAAQQIANDTTLDAVTRRAAFEHMAELARWQHSTRYV